MAVSVSRGLSDQQRRIFSMGVRINRAIHLGEVKPTIELVDAEQAWWTSTLPEVTTRAAMRFVHGMEFRPDGERPGGSLFVPRPRQRSLEASTSRALKALSRENYLWWRGGQVPDSVGKLGSVGAAVEHKIEGGAEWVGLALAEGYKLTPKGVEIGLRHEPDTPLEDVRRDLIHMMRLTNGWELHAMSALLHLDKRARAASAREGGSAVQGPDLPP